MREILFRGKKIENGEWIVGNLTIWSDKTTSIDAEPTEGSILWAVVPETVGQYTGLTDTNGKKVFEGDIIRYADIYDYNCYLESLENKEAYDKWDFGDIWVIDKVCYFAEEGYPAFDLCKHEFDTNGLSELSESMQYYYYEVIGNIHDNPELLEVK